MDKLTALLAEFSVKQLVLTGMVLGSSLVMASAVTIYDQAVDPSEIDNYELVQVVKPTVVPKPTEVEVEPSATPEPTSAVELTPVEYVAAPSETPTTIAPTDEPKRTSVSEPTATTAPTATSAPTETPTPTPDPADNMPVLKNLMVNFGKYKAATGYGGDFLFDANREKLFYTFGEVVTGPGGDKVLPTFEYYVKKNAPVYAVADGVVGGVTSNGSPADYEIFVTPEGDTYWQIWYDHVLNVTVSKGDTITAGQQIGVAGIWSDTLSRTELMVRYSYNNESYTVCPFNLFSPSLKSTYQGKITQHMADWEDFKSDTSLYDESSHTAPGCRFSQITE